MYLIWQLTNLGDCESRYQIVATFDNVLLFERWDLSSWCSLGQHVFLYILNPRKGRFSSSGVDVEDGHRHVA